MVYASRFHFRLIHAAIGACRARFIDMAQILEFATNHLFLVGAFAAISGMLIFTTIQGSGVAKVGVAEATRLINHDDGLVLDVRTDAEYNGGHIIGSVHVPLNQLKTQIAKLEKHKARPIIATCRTGQRSAGACGILAKDGFEKVYNLRGGIMAWQDSNLPLTKK